MTNRKYYQSDLFGNISKEPDTKAEGNVVLGFCSNHFLMLDIDEQIKNFCIRFVKEYTNYHKLGSVLILKTSESNSIDFFGNKLGNFAAIFGKPLSKKEIMWHIGETKRLGIINRGFAKMRYLDGITIRVNSKNEKTQPPEVIKFYSHGCMKGILRYISYRNLCEDVGESWKIGK
jgi:hypothetical protein